MPFVVAFVALVALVQSVAWLGSPRATASQQRVAMFLAPVALLGFALALVAWRIPEFFS